MICGAALLGSDQRIGSLDHIIMHAVRPVLVIGVNVKPVQNPEKSPKGDLLGTLRNVSMAARVH